MGGSHSKTKTNIMNETLNSTDISSINKNVMEASVESLIKNAASCSSSVNQTNACSMSNIDASGNIVIGGNQSNKAKVNFSCIQSTIAAAEMASSMEQAIMGELKSLSNTEAAAKINAAAASANKSGAGSWGGGSSSAVVDTENSNIVSNQTKQTIENIYQKHLKNNFNSETVNECIGRTRQENTLNISNIKAGGSIEANCNQSNSLEQVQECKQLSEALNKTLEKTVQELGFKVVTDNVNLTKAEIEAKSHSENENTGPIQDLTNGLDGALSGLTGMASLASLGAMAPFIIICCIICCLLVSSIFFMKSGGGSGGEVMQAQQYGPQYTYDVPSDTTTVPQQQLYGGHKTFDTSISESMVGYSINILSDIFTE